MKVIGNHVISIVNACFFFTKLVAGSSVIIIIVLCGQMSNGVEFMDQSINPDHYFTGCLACSISALNSSY